MLEPRSKEAGKNRLLMIDIDSADIDFIRGHLEYLPTMRRFFSEGQFARLKSDGGELGASAWPSFLTGLRPGDHGQYYPLQWNPHSMKMRAVGEDFRFRDPFWYEMAREGIPVVAFDVQMAFESRLSLGFEVKNWTGQSFCELQSNQPRLLREIISRFGRHPMGHDIPADWAPSERRKMKAQIDSGVRRTGEISRWLMKRCEWGLFITSFVESHRAGHYLIAEKGGAHEEGWLVQVLMAIDQELAAIIDETDLSGTTVVVFSLEGMKPCFTQMHFMPKLMEIINHAFLSRSGNGPSRPRKQRNLMKLMRERLPSEWQGHVGRRAPTWIRDWVVGRQFAGGLKWADTPGFALPCGGESFIRLNIKGRESAGMLVPDSGEVEEYCAMAEECLRSFRDAETGKPLVRDILYARDAFPGGKSHLLPDMIVLWHDQPPARTIISETYGALSGRYTTGRQGLHCSRGFAAAIGNQANAGMLDRTRHVADLGDLAKRLLLPSAQAG